MRVRNSKSAVPDALRRKEDKMLSTGTETGTSMTQNTKSSNKPDPPETVKMTLYISKPVAKNFKILAIEQDMEYSELAQHIFEEYVQERRKH